MLRISPVTVDNFAVLLIHCMPVEWESDTMIAPTYAIHLVVWSRSFFVYCLVQRDSNDDLVLFQIFVGVV